MKTGFFNSFICVVLIVLVISGMVPGIAFAVEDIPDPEDNENLTVVDLVLDSLSFNPENPESGKEVKILASVKNQGTGASESTNLAYSVNGSRIGDSIVPRMEAGKSEQISFSWKSEAKGTVQITAKVDEQDSVPEINENNNEKTKSLTFKNAGFPDLVISSLKYPETPEPGEHQNVHIRVKNQGTSESGETKLKFYTDGKLAKEWNIPTLSAGEESESFSDIWVPIFERTVELKAVVDEENLVIESNEGNNQKIDMVAVAEKFLPDLVVEDVLPQHGDPQEGKLSNFTVKIKNQGIAPSGEGVATYYINGKAANESLYIPALSKGAGTNVSFSRTPDKAGKMEVKVFVDSEKAVYESNETNNELIKIINIKAIPPDLKIESISLKPETPKLGDNITFTVTIKNNGPGDAPGNELKYSINGTNETYNGKMPVSALFAGNTTSGNFSWTPKNEGKIEVKAIVDAARIVAEVEENNNEFIKTANIFKETEPSSEEKEKDSGSSSSGGSGGSRSSGGGGEGKSISKEPAGNVDSKELSTRHIISGYHVKFEFVENATCITYIEFDPKKTFKKTTTIVEELKNKSTFVPELPPGNIYKHVNIWVDQRAGLPGSFENGFIEFKVNKTWIKEKNINQSLITLQWYDNGWQSLYTEKSREDRDYVYFKAETPGFSCFAITEYPVDEKNIQEMKEEGKTEETLKSSNSESKASNLDGNAEESGLIKDPMGKAKILMAISLPMFLILIEYFVLKKKI